MTTLERIYSLPAYPNTFIGRIHHIHAIRTLLDEEHKRLITLLGPGGIGKTRLAVRIGEVVADRFAHGVCFVALDMVADPEQVPLYIGHRLGLKAGAGGNWMETIVDFLAARELLLILDNLEQILPAARVIDQLLNECPQVKVLATSREVLGLPRELEYPLDSLNRPNPRLFPSPGELIRFDAIDLFVQKARSSRPDFALTAENSKEVVQICQELDGLPLPIELAAARIKLFSPRAILEKLSSRLDLLRTHTSGVVPRHQNIRNTIQWSYDLLDAEEQGRFRQLALFRAGFTLDALEAIFPEQDAVAIVESFVNKSLIVKAREVDGIPRFRMLKLIRDYGLEQLELQADKVTYYRRFSDYHLAFLQQIDAQLRPVEPTRWREQVEAAYENLEVALEWLVAGDTEAAAQVGVLFWRFHLARGFLREGRAMIEKLLRLPIEKVGTKARLLTAAGTLSHNLGEHLEARAYFEQCLGLWEALGDELELVAALNNLAWAAWRLGNYDQTLVRSNEALAISRREGDASGQAKSLNNLAWIHFYRAQYSEAETLHRQVLDIHLRTEDLKGIAFAKVNLGWALMRNGKLLEAGQLIRVGIDIFHKLKNQQMLTFSRTIMAEYQLMNHELGSAEALLLEYCLPDFEKIGDLWGVAQTHYWLARVYQLQGEPRTAAGHLRQAREQFGRSNDKYGQAMTDFWWSRLCREQEERAAAEAALEQSLIRSAEMQVNDLLAFGHLERAYRALEEDKIPAALQHLALADYYAAAMGNYQYGKFREEAATCLEAVPRLPAVETIDLAQTFDEAHWSIPDDQWGNIPDKSELPERLRGLLRHIAPITPASSLQSGVNRSTQNGPGAQDDAPFVRQVRRIITAHLSDPDFTVKRLCRELRMSHSQVHRRLREQTGYSTSQFIRHIRIEQAKNLLQDPQLTVTAVAYDTGFRDADYFYRVFRQMVGMTPGEYRKGEMRL